MNYLIVTFAYLLDLIFSEPKRIPHPVVMIGKIITFFEEQLYREKDSDKLKFIKGMVLTVLVLAVTFLVVYAMVAVALAINVYLYIALSSVLVSFTISTEALKKAAVEIYELLSEKRIKEARQKVAMIVGRDTDDLNEEEISRAVVETVSENIVDGVTSPLFYAFIGGAPLAFLYRAVNTLDSMVGYKNERYLFFGRFSARVDDVFNFIPARLTALLIVLVAMLHPKYDGRLSFKTMVKDASKHPSPNGGYTESAAAGAMKIRLGGYNSYFGKESFRAYMGIKIDQTDRSKIIEVVEIMYFSTFAWIVCNVLIGYFF